MAVRTASGGTPRARLRALAGGHGGDDGAGPGDAPLPLGHRVRPQALERRTRLGSLYAVRPEALNAWGQPLRPHPANTGRHVNGGPLHPRALLGALMLGDAVAILAVDTPERARRPHDLLGQGARPALGAGRDLPVWHVRDQPLALPGGTGIDQPPARRRLDGRAPPRQQLPLPLLAPHGRRHVIQMPPWLRLPIPAATSGGCWVKGGCPGHGGHACG
jgi:hypothetical protein